MHDDRDGGLERDLAFLAKQVERRKVLRWAMRIGLVPLVGCGESAARSSDDGASGKCAPIPEETEGPFPGDGSNGPNVLAQSGIVRRDIRSSLDGGGTADGVVLTMNLTLVNAATCAPLAGYAAYVWHCDAEGRYSIYSPGVTDQDYLRGVQAADADGKLTFTTVFPGCYAGRWPHIHFEVYPALAAATTSANEIATSQLAFPKADCDKVYATAAYGGSAANLAQLSLASDGIFRDGVSRQLAATSGSVAGGYTASLTVPVTVRV